MSKRTWVVGLGVAVVAGFWAAQVSGGGRTDSLGILGFGLAAMLVEAFDVSLPRGDVVDMGIPLAFAPALLFGPASAIAVILISRLGAAVIHARTHSLGSIAEDIARRSFSVMWASVVFYALGGTARSLGAPLPMTLLTVLVAAGVCLLLNTLATQAGASMRIPAPFLPLVTGNLRLLGWVSLAQVSVACLATLAYPNMNLWGLPMVVALLLVMRQSLALLIDIKKAYRSTAEVLARALEAQSPDRRGHAERVAGIAGESARALGIHGQALEDLTHAALFHDVGQLGADEDGCGATGAAFVLRDVTLMKGALPILEVLDERGEIAESLAATTLIAAYVIARASQFDDSEHGRACDDIASKVGARLYASTRGDVDRVLGRIESRVRLVGLAPLSATGDPW